MQRALPVASPNERWWFSQLAASESTSSVHLHRALRSGDAVLSTVFVATIYEPSRMMLPGGGIVWGVRHNPYFVNKCVEVVVWKGSGDS